MSEHNRPSRTTAEAAAFNTLGKLGWRAAHGGTGPTADFDDPNDWQASADRAVQSQRLLRARGLLYAVILVVIGLLVWAWWAELDEVTRGEARVVPSSQRQLIQSFDGGVVSEIRIEEGQIVEAGELLMQLDPTRFSASVRESQAEYYGLLARAARLEALASGTDFIPPSNVVEMAPEMASRERRQYQSNLEELSQRRLTAGERLQQREEELTEAIARRAQVRRSLDITRRELEITLPLLETGAVAEVEVLRLERDLSNAEGDLEQVEAQVSRSRSAVEEAESSLVEIDLTARADWRRELAETENRLASLSESLMGLEDRVRFTEIRSPVRGIVQRLYVTTRGGVVQPGREVLEIVPLDDQLIVEARISPQDIAFIREGQRAVVKLSAYDFAIFGGLDGVVQMISADTLTDENDNTYYLVRIRTEETPQTAGLGIIPGMTAQVDIITGKKTVLNYLLKPVLRARDQALRER